MAVVDVVTVAQMVVNTGGLLGLCFVAGRYAQRLADAEKRVDSLESQKNEVLHAKLETKVDSLVSTLSGLEKSMQALRLKVDWLAQVLAIRNAREDSAGLVAEGGD